MGPRRASRRKSLVKSKSLLAECSLAARSMENVCAWCAASLPPRRRSWCSDRCGDAFWTNHWWSLARRATKRRDKYRCKRCGTRAPKRPAKASYRTQFAYNAAVRAWRKAKRVGRLEVNHIVPCAGKHGELSCAHHLENLETLCAGCHKEHTASLRLPPPAVAVVAQVMLAVKASPPARRSG